MNLATLTCGVHYQILDIGVSDCGIILAIKKYSFSCIHISYVLFAYKIYIFFSPSTDITKKHNLKKLIFWIAYF